LGLTYEEVSEKTGITVSALTSYVEGRIVPKAPVLIRLEKVLDCSASYLLEGEE
jgi:transcriptional regulator with XRE-family HTH domain